MAKVKVAARLSIYKPGLLTPKGAKELAKWLKHQAKCLENHRDAYTSGSWFVARYLYADKPKCTNKRRK